MSENEEKLTVVIDSEVHLLHPDARRSDYVAGSKEPVRRVIHEHREFDIVARLMDEGALLRSMGEHGIDKCVIMGLSWLDSALQRENNAYISDVVRAHPEKFVGFYIPHLVDLDEAAAEVSQLDPNIFVGVKLLPGWQMVHIDDPRLDPLFDAMVARNIPLMVHTDHITQSLNGDTAYRLIQFLMRRPDVKVLAPHLGGLLCLYGLMPGFRRIIDQVLFITSVSATMRMVEFAVRVNPENVAFGTDYPFNHCHNQSDPLAAVHALGLPSETVNAILSQNFVKWFRANHILLPFIDR